MERQTSLLRHALQSAISRGEGCTLTGCGRGLQRRGLVRGLAALPLALLLPGCGGGGGGGDGTAAPDTTTGGDTTGGDTTSLQQRRVYVGEAVGEAMVVNRFLLPVERRQYRHEMLVEFNPPRQAVVGDATVTEPNPFNLAVVPQQVQALPPGSEGQFILMSGLVGVDPRDGRTVAETYWRLRLDGAAFEGELVVDAVARGMAANRINLPEEQPVGGFHVTAFAMGVGTRLSGTFTDSELQLRIEGRTRDTYRSYVIEIKAARAQ